MKQDNFYSKYPKYSDGQILRSEDLNNSFNYLKNQLNKTRLNIFGGGVLWGLNYEISSDKITIFAGLAITKDGNIIEIKENIEYRYAVNKQHYTVDTYPFNQKDSDLDYYLLNTEQKAKNCVPIKNIKNISQFSLGIFINEDVIIQENCSETSCSIENRYVKLEFQPFLITNSHINYNNQVENVEELKIPRLKISLQFRDVSLFYRIVIDYFYDTLDIIKNKLQTLKDIIFKEKELNEINNCINKIKFNSNFISVYLSFIFDLYKAINELIDWYNDYVLKYNIGCQDEKFINGIILTKSISTKNYLDIYNSTFASSIILNKYQDNIILNRYKNRLFWIVNNFLGHNTSTDAPIKIEAVKVGAKLGEHVIPYYYKITDEFLEFWDAHNLNHLSNKVVDYANFHSSYNDNDKKNFYYNYFNDTLAKYVIHGNIAINKDTLRSNIDKHIFYNDLNFRLSIFELKGSKTYSDYSQKDIKNNSNAALNNIRPKIKDEIAKKIITDYIKQSQNNYYTTKELYKKIDKVQLKNLQNKVNESLTNKDNIKIDKSYWHFIDDFNRYVNIMNNEKDYTIENMHFEFIGGVNKNNHLCLIIYQNKVLLCVDRPYLFYLKKNSKGKKCLSKEPNLPIDKPKKPVERPKEPVERPKEPVERPKKSVERPKEPVERPKKSIERPNKPVERPNKPVERPKKSVEKPNKPVERPNKPVERPKKSVEKPIDKHIIKPIKKGNKRKGGL